MRCFLKINAISIFVYRNNRFIVSIFQSEADIISKVVVEFK